ncbi:hypothetical protein [Wolbachia endosymbiont (group A) of Gastracanthus pulcherrimus]|uniref:hypothetical protein n=1 Tax=Wolbachia endosymbiont (group A) of Gastracanthus pulcherrimus TaxID=3066200 RepID=UPI003341EB16
MSGHWDDTIIKESVSATFMTPFFFLDPSSRATWMTASLTTVIPLTGSGIYAKRYRE